MLASALTMLLVTSMRLSPELGHIGTHVTCDRSDSGSLPDIDGHTFLLFPQQLPYLPKHSSAH